MLAGRDTFSTAMSPWCSVIEALMLQEDTELGVDLKPPTLPLWEKHLCMQGATANMKRVRKGEE